MGNIYIIQDKKHNTESSLFIEMSLREVFKESVSITTIDGDSLPHPGVWNSEETLLIVTPPIIGHTSSYNELFPEKTRRWEYRFIEHGGVSVRICAGAYHAFEDIEFKSPSTGDLKQKKSSTPLIKGTAYGPLKGLGRPHLPIECNRPDSVATPIEYSINGKVFLFDSFYGNGCSFNTDDPNADVIARYAHNDENQIAGVKKKIGHGHVIALGVEPHYGHQEHVPDHLKELNDALEPHEAMRRLFMQHFWLDIADHGISRGTITSEDLVETKYQQHKRAYSM